MPELPEVEALALDLKGRLTDRAIVKVHVAAFSALKTFDPPLSALEGTLVEDVTRHGKFLDIRTSAGLHLVLHLARAGWVRWRDEVPDAPAEAEQQVAARRARRADGRRLTRRPGSTSPRPAPGRAWRCTSCAPPATCPASPRLGPDPLVDEFTIERLREILEREGRKQIKGVLRHQGTIAGIGNAYSDELLHAARMSPFKPANSLTDDELRTLYDAIRDRPRRRGRPLARPGRQRAEGREEVAPRRPRPHRPALPGLRRHRPRGLLRRLQPAVLPDLPDRRQAAGRPPDVPPAEVRASPSGQGDGLARLAPKPRHGLPSSG